VTEQVTRKDSFLFLAIFEGALREEGTFFLGRGLKDRNVQRHAWVF